MNISNLRSPLRQLHYWLKGYPLYRHREELEKSQFFSRAELATWQDEKLRKLIRHVYQTVPYYRQRMDELKLLPQDIRGVTDLEKFPILNRSDIRRHSANLISSTGSVGRPIWCKTGGTTGEPLRTANDLRGQAWSNAAYYRGLSWAGYELDRDRMACLFGGSLAHGRSVTSSPWRIGGQNLFLSAMDVREETVRDYWNSLQKFQPCFLKAYAAPTYLLAKGFAEAGLPPPNIKAIFTTSEYQPLAQRRFVEQTLHTQVYDYYGSVEINSLGYQCSQRGTDYHIPEEHAVIETLPDPDEQLPEPNGGSFLITDLDNYYMPLIRYRNGDAGVLSDTPCACGRSLKRIGRLYGRISDFLRSTAGTLVYGGTIDYVLGDTHHIREFCLIQETPTLCRLQFVADGTESEIPRAIERLHQFLGADMRIVPEQVEKIPLTRSGKRRFTISKLDEDREGLPATVRDPSVVANVETPSLELAR
ncbi:MAG: phenylacetate--CoA ligase family protein [Planctomycetales bacterium]|nr:phenylacetate--CoA ligase family protein [Planctomycetales bacterium]